MKSIVREVLVRFHQHLRDGFGVLRGQDLVTELDQLAVEAIQRQVAHLEVDVRGTLLDAQPQQAVKLFAFHCSTPSARMQSPIPSGDSAWRIGRFGGALTRNRASARSRAPARSATLGAALPQVGWRREGPNVVAGGTRSCSPVGIASLRGRAASRSPLALCRAVAAGGAEPEAKAAPPPAVDLDRLLQLPPIVEVPREQIGSATRSQWRARFTSARAEHEAAQAGLEAAQKQLGTVAEDTEAWQIAPPGSGTAGASEAPVDYQLKQELRRQREELARSERRLRDLTIEADLAGVPADWRE